MSENVNSNEGKKHGLEEELKHLKEEVQHEKQVIDHEQKELEHQKKDVEYLEHRVKEMEHEMEEEKRHHHHAKDIEIKFIVNGTPTDVDAKEDWLLKRAAEKALEQTGNVGRPVEDWDIKQGTKTLDANEVIAKYDFPECVELVMSLDAGHGGAIVCRQ